LTTDTIWIQHTWQLRAVPLQGLAIESLRNGKELAMIPKPSAEKLTLAFASAAEGERWFREVQLWQQLVNADSAKANAHQPEGVALVRQAPAVPHEALGQVECTGQNQWAADRGLQIRAGIRGADAIISLHRQTCREVGWRARHVSGLAVRVGAGDAQKRLRLRWYDEEVWALVNRMLLLLVLQAALLFLLVTFCAGASSVNAATGETLSEALASAGQGLGMLYTWPLALLALLRVLRWPQLLRPTGLTVLAATTGRGLTVLLAHLLAVGTTRASFADSKIWLLADPVEWAFIIAGVVLCVRAWRLARDARHILPQEVQIVSTARKAWAHGLLAATGVYALAFLGLVGTARYRQSAHLLQPGVDSRREQQALLAFNEGVAQSEKGDLASAEQSWQRSLRLWEELTARRSAPSIYRCNLATTLNNLGWIREQRGRIDEAEKYYARAVSLADELAGYPQLDDEFKRTMAGAQEALAGLRAGRRLKLLDEKDQAAGRKYEEALVKAQQGAAEAEGLYREAITLWEEVLPQATNPEYQKQANYQLAFAYLHLAELQRQKDQRSKAEANLKKSIDYGEKAVHLDPDRPLPKHNLEVARRKLEALHEQALQEEIDKLCNAERFADAIDLCLRSIEEQEEQVRSGKDRDEAVRRLAYRLDRFAWFLAHCPDGRLRDTKAAVKHARRATELQSELGEYWHTLAMVQYRNGDWRDSLDSLEKVRVKDGGLDASDWFLSAMSMHQLKRREEARAAFRKAVEWFEEQQRKAEDNALLRFQFEMMRPAIEDLRREAQKLLEGKDPANQGVG
jgi:tetratricopeptide (TPR) repeat protein